MILSSLILALPIPSLKQGRKVYPNVVLLPKGVTGLPHDSLALTHQMTYSATKPEPNSKFEIPGPDLVYRHNSLFYVQTCQMKII